MAMTWRRPSVCSVEMSLRPSGALGAAPQGGQVLGMIDEAMRNGFLLAAQRKDGCKGCEYLPGEKSPPELMELRSWR